MAKVDNSTKGWGNVLKPQGQAETPIVIQPREMKLDELVAVLDKMSGKGEKSVPYDNFISFPDMLADDGTYPTVKEFEFFPDRNAYYAHLEEGDLHMNIRVLDSDGIASVVKNLQKQRLADEIGINTEYKLPEPLKAKFTDSHESIVDSVMITDEYHQLNFTYKGKNIYPDGEVEEVDYDPEMVDGLWIENSVTADVYTGILNDIEKKKNIAVSPEKEMRDKLVDGIRNSGVMVDTNMERIVRHDHEAAGFTQGSVMYVNPSKATAKDPIILYSFLWMDNLIKNDPEKWQSVVNMVKRDNMTEWDSLHYHHPEMKPDDIAQQIIAHGCGIRGAEHFLKNGITPVSAAAGAIDTSSKLSDRILNDLAAGLNPNRKDQVLKDIDIPVVERPMTDREAVQEDPQKALHDNFEKLMEESEKQTQNRGLKV